MVDAIGRLFERLTRSAPIIINGSINATVPKRSATVRVMAG